jgi:hypothetical protein
MVKGMAIEMSDPTPSSRAEGRMIADRYQIERLSQEDATTLTMTARHLSLDELVEIKFLRPELRLDARVSARFSSATKALARIKTDHVLRVLDVGTALSVGPYLVQEHLEGSSLADLLHSEGKLSVARAVDYVLQACKGLAVAHAAGIVHRSVQPRSLFVARRGEFETLKLIDFSTGSDASAAAIAPAESAPASRAVPEQTQHLAPEVILGDPGVDQRADVWSLGAVLYELVTGRPASTDGQQRDLPVAEDLALSPSLRRIIARCLQPDCSQRFQNVDELAAELLPLTTMNEVFRGSLTGSFSRQMFMAAAAQAQASAVLAARPRPRSWGEQLAARVQSAMPPLEWQRLRPRLPRAALEQSAVVAGTLLVVALGTAMGDLTLVPPPSLRHSLPRGGAGEQEALVAAAPQAVEAAAAEPTPMGPAPVAEPLPSPGQGTLVQRAWALQPEPAPPVLPTEEVTAKPSHAHKPGGKKPSGSAARASHRRTIVRIAEPSASAAFQHRR